MGSHPCCSTGGVTPLLYHRWGHTPAVALGGIAHPHWGTGGSHPLAVAPPPPLWYQPCGSTGCIPGRQGCGAMPPLGGVNDSIRGLSQRDTCGERQACNLLSSIQATRPHYPGWNPWLPRYYPPAHPTVARPQRALSHVQKPRRSLFLRAVCRPSQWTCSGRWRKAPTWS